MLSMKILKPGNDALGTGEWRQEASVTQVRGPAPRWLLYLISL